MIEILLVILFIMIVLLAANVRIVPQAYAYVIERLGGYDTTWGVGLHFKIPFLDRVAKKVNLKEQVVDFPPQAAILRAEADKEQRIREAEGQAEAIRVVQMANAEGIKFLKEAGADEAVLTIKKLEAFEKAANGNATKIIIPSEIQGVAGLTKSVGEILK